MKIGNHYNEKVLAIYTEYNGPVFIGKVALMDDSHEEGGRIRLSPSIVESGDNPSNVCSIGYLTSPRFAQAMQGELVTEVSQQRIIGFTDITDLTAEYVR